MPRYRFNIHNAIGFIPDEQGQELPDLEAARAEALRGARSLLAEEVRSGQMNLCGRLEVRDEKDDLVLTLPFAGAVDIIT